MQKTWDPRGLQEYLTFKKVTRENDWILQSVRAFWFRHPEYEIGPKDLILDVGGRDGSVALGLAKAHQVHLVDPDPNVEPPSTLGKFWRQRVQDVVFDSSVKYKVIIFWHALGYVSEQGVTEETLKTLVGLLDEGGTLVLGHNLNDEYMGSLLQFARQRLERTHYDYFDEELLTPYRISSRFELDLDFGRFRVEYPNFEALARCCWFLFGTVNPDIDTCAKRFLRKLRHDLESPYFFIHERVWFVTKRRRLHPLQALGRLLRTILRQTK